MASFDKKTGRIFKSTKYRRRSNLSQIILQSEINMMKISRYKVLHYNLFKRHDTRTHCGNS